MASETDSSSTSHIRFYQDLPSVDNLSDITNSDIYHDMPTDWYIALTDVQGSTKAIEQGRYKEVNAVAAASITALLNSVPTEIDIPFVFGGDGATVVIPPQVITAAAEALVATQRLAHDQFGFNLRVGIVPVQDVLAHGYQVRVAKLRFSDNFRQAIFTGGGLAFADKLIKDSATAPIYLIQDDGKEYHADFSGYECRWSEFPSTYDENVNILVMATTRTLTQSTNIYNEVILKIEEIYGDSSKRNPIAFDKMRPQTDLSKFGVETRIRQQTTALMSRLGLMFWTWGGFCLWKYRDKIWDKYKHTVIASTDREKFDDVLRMLISGTIAQREHLTTFLEEKYQLGQLVYGLHTSKTALMTCLVFDRFGKQVHFVDGSNGGYTLAAKQLKTQLAERNQQTERPVLAPH
jgi:hypothetical protein